MRRDQPSVAATRHDLMPSAAQSSSTVNSMVTITGTGDHDRPEWLITVAGIRTLVYSPNAKYLYIGREGRDVIWSMHNHWINSNADMYAAINDTPGRVGPLFERPPASTRKYFADLAGARFHPPTSGRMSVRGGQFAIYQTSL